MKKISKILIVISMLTVSMFIFAGCQSSSSSSDANSTKQQGKKFDKSAMQQRMKTNLEALVKAGTITEDQSSKILTALTSRTQGSKGNSAEGNSANGYGRRNGGQTALNALVQQGTITQAQEEAVLKSVTGNRQNNSGNSTGNN